MEYEHIIRAPRRELNEKNESSTLLHFTATDGCARPGGNVRLFQYSDVDTRANAYAYSYTFADDYRANANIHADVNTHDFTDTDSDAFNNSPTPADSDPHSYGDRRADGHYRPRRPEHGLR